MSESTRPHVWCGIDIGKSKFCAAVANAKGTVQVIELDNRTSSFAKLLAWARRHAGEGTPVKFCMESTGDYGDNLALFLADSGVHVSVVNPAEVKRFGVYKGFLNKTDMADAKIIALYAADAAPKAWQFTDPARRELFRLIRRVTQLTKMEAMELNRKECPEAIGKTCMKSIEDHLAFIRKEKRALQAAIAAIIEADVQLKKAYELITSIPALGKGSANIILVDMPPVEAAASAKEWAAASGTNAVTRKSGTSLNTSRMSRKGRKSVRCTLWMPTLLGRKKMRELEDLYDRLRARGRNHKQALTACVHKMLMIVYGVLKNHRPYEPPQNNPPPEPT